MDGNLRRWRLPAAVLTGAYALLLAWLAATAFTPELLPLAPEWLAWLATPGSAPAMSVGLLLSGAAFAAVLASRVGDSSRVPFLLSAWCAASAMPLAMAAYLPCTGDAPPFWTAVTASFSLLLGNFEAAFGTGQACAHQVPLGLQLGRLLAILATLSGAASVLFAVSRSQLDRFAVLRARHLTVVAGLDESSWPVLQQLAGQRDGGRRIVLLTSDASPLADRAHAAGVLALRTPASDPLGLRGAVPWHRTGRCYLLAADAALNRTRATALREAFRPGPDDRTPQERGDQSRGRRLTVVARIDDPWQAEDWRKRLIGTPGFVFDAIGIYEATADALVGRLDELHDIDELVVAGEPPLVLALCAELSQRGREAQFLDGHAGLPKVTLIDSEAGGIVADHRVRQQRFASDPLRLAAVDAPPSLDSVTAQLRRITDAGGRPAVVVGHTDTRLGTRLAVRHPELPVFELTAGSRPVAGDEPTAGGLRAFSLALGDAGGRSADAWERAARAVHERYRRRFPDAAQAVPWAELPREFYRESNRRQLHSILDAMAGLGRSWAPTSPEPETGPDPDQLTGAGATDRIEAGLARFDLTAAEVARVAELEHDSWLRHYLADGWRPGSVRNDRERRHPDLKPWAELDDAARRKTQAGVIDTLFALRALGYRSVPIAPPGDGWGEYERVGEIRAERLEAPVTWRSADGDELAGAAGDWLVVDASGGRRTVTDASFRASHRHLGEDRWLRTGCVRARPADPGETIPSQEGAVTASSDSWVVRDADGNQWIVPGDHLRSAYRPVSQA